MHAGSTQADALRLGATIEGIAAVCPSCGEGGLEVFHDHDEIPVHSCRLVATVDEARAFPRGRLSLGFCRSCGFITNVAYDGSLQDYSVAYEETQGFSSRFQAFAHELAVRWVDQFDLRGKKIVEIGCGKGEFLAALCEIGGNSGVGIDPSYVPNRLPDAQERRLTFLQDLYSEEHLDLPADAIVCRHTLEHIQPVLEFMNLVRGAAEQNPGAVVLFELPDVGRVLREVAFWDIYYEHCSYFSCGSLGRLFRRAGFDVLGVGLEYDEQYIVLEARLGDTTRAAVSPLEESVAELAGEVGRFRGRFDGTLTHWRGLLADSAAAGERAVIWGAGSKGVSFLTTLGIDSEIEYAVDINPHKHGKFMPATGQEIVPPLFLEHYRPDLVIAMNSIYLDEIGAQLAAMNLAPRLLGV
jgi:SAM-dependent methyltransferase